MLATNWTGDLDAAVLDSCDESLLFPLPDEPCRELLLTQYFTRTSKLPPGAVTTSRCCVETILPRNNASHPLPDPLLAWTDRTHISGKGFIIMRIV